MRVFVETTLDETGDNPEKAQPKMSGEMRVAQWVRALAIAVGVLFSCIEVAAQEKASIIGQVTDQTGAALPGVTISASSPSLQVPVVTVVTDEKGEYRITLLPIGVYTTRYELSGFQAAQREGAG